MWILFLIYSIIMSDFYKNINLNNNRIENVGNPINGKDAVNLEYLQNVLESTAYDTTVSVNVSSVDNYIGVSDQTITSYQLNVVYIITFANSNTITNPTLDIDGVGSISLKKPDNTGLIDLEVGDIISGVQYFLTYNGSTFQIHISKAVDINNFTYSNATPVPVTIGGIASGTTFSSVPITTMFDLLLYPYQDATFTSFGIQSQSTLLEAGATVSNTSRVFTWATSNSSYITPNTINIYSITGGTTLLLGSASNTGSATITLPAPIMFATPSSYSWQITGKRTNNVTFSRNFTVSWAFKMYTGISGNALLTQTDVLAFGGTIATGITGTYTFGAGGYKYFVIPNNLANPVTFKDQATNLGVGMADATDGYSDTNAGVYSFKYLSVTNVNGVTQTYRVYRTKYTLGGSINIIVS